jgi:hypothetical protein
MTSWDARFLGQSAHKIRSLPYGNLHPMKGGKREDTSQLYSQFHNRIQNSNLEAAPKNFANFTTNGKLHHP